MTMVNRSYVWLCNACFAKLRPCEELTIGRLKPGPCDACGAACGGLGELAGTGHCIRVRIYRDHIRTFPRMQRGLVSIMMEYLAFRDAARRSWIRIAEYMGAREPERFTFRLRDPIEAPPSPPYDGSQRRRRYWKRVFEVTDVPATVPAERCCGCGDKMKTFPMTRVETSTGESFFACSEECMLVAVAACDRERGVMYAMVDRTNASR